MKNRREFLHLLSKGDKILYFKDLYPDLHLAYSSMRLSKEELFVYNVRRSSDDETKDFKENEVTDGTLEAWVGAGNDGYVTSSYDVSGGGLPLQTTSLLYQPTIVTSGALNLENGTPYLFYDGNGDYRSPSVESTGLTSTNGTIFTIYNSSDASGGRLCSTNDSGTNIGIHQSGSGTVPDASVGTPSYYINGSLTELTRTRGALYSAIVTGQDVLITITNLNFSASSQWSKIFPWAYRASTAGSAIAKTKEMLIFNSDVSSIRGDIEDSINNRFNIY